MSNLLILVLGADIQLLWSYYVFIIYILVIHKSLELLCLISLLLLIQVTQAHTICFPCPKVKVPWIVMFVNDTCSAPHLPHMLANCMWMVTTLQHMIKDQRLHIYIFVKIFLIRNQMWLLYIIVLLTVHAYFGPYNFLYTTSLLSLETILHQYFIYHEYLN